MGLAAELSYTYRPPNGFQRVVQVLVSTRPGAWFLSKTVARLDRFVSDLTRDRVVVPGREEILRNAAGVYRCYLKYQQHIEGRRRLRIFVLEFADQHQVPLRR